MAQRRRKGDSECLEGISRGSNPKQSEIVSPLQLVAHALATPLRCCRFVACVAALLAALLEFAVYVNYAQITTRQSGESSRTKAKAKEADGRTDEQTRRMKKATWQTENSRDAMRMQRKLKLLAKRCDARMKE